MAARIFGWLLDNWANAVTAFATLCTAILMAVELRRKKAAEFPMPEVVVTPIQKRSGWARAEVAVNNYLPYPIYWTSAQLRKPSHGAIYDELDAFARDAHGSRVSGGEWVAEERPRPEVIVNAKIAAAGLGPTRTGPVLLAEGDRVRRVFYIWCGPRTADNVTIRLRLLYEHRTQSVVRRAITIKRVVALSAGG